jgi:SAM-dependent methyltransferase
MTTPAPETFKDLFAAGAADYARFRPRYPDALFSWLAQASPSRTLAVDVGTGSGQAAVALAACFDRVIGLDPSASQLARAEAHPRVEYRVAPAEALSQPPHADLVGSVDLLLAAQAFHWFVAERFFAEAARVLRPRGVLALITYNLCVVTPEVDRVVGHLYRDHLGAYWEPERRLVESGYAGVAPPHASASNTLAAPPLQLQHELTCDELIGYLGTWSALGRARKETGKDPLAEVTPALRAAFGVDPTPGHPLRRPVVWPLVVRAWRNDS